MKKVLVLLLLSISFLFGAIDLQTATKKELMSIKGIGAKKAAAILKYRKSNTINSADDLKNIKGFGPGIISNVKEDKKVSKKQLQKKKKISKIEKNKNKKIKKINKSKMTKEQKQARKQKARQKAKERKEKVRQNENN